MLFHSYGFIFLFLPLVLLGFFLLGRLGDKRWALAGLTLASLLFYAWWNVAYLPLLILSIGVNYLLGRTLAGVPAPGAGRRLYLTLGIVFNLLLLGYFKYAGFAVETLNQVTGGDYELNSIVLPLAISFFTFQQIAYLVDAYYGKAREYSFLNYTLFVSFFPQLIAGPIVHHGEMMPQFEDRRIFRPRIEQMDVGLLIFVIGLFKKVFLADGMAQFSEPVFSLAGQGETLSFLDAWGGALAYTLQIYFDFSAYSDMAIGLAWMLGISLPFNFASPYKASSIIDFWRRWHMTLSRFLRDYLYIPLGGNRKGKGRRYLNVMVTMLLGGLWHGAAWTFVAWGGIHGLLLMINHGWRALRRRLGWEARRRNFCGRLLASACTFLAVTFAWVFFRAESFSSASSLLSSMMGLRGMQMPLEWHSTVVPAALWGWLGILLPVVWLAPNSQEIAARYRRFYEALPVRGIGSYLLTHKRYWLFPVLLVAGLLEGLVIAMEGAAVAPFIYFQF